MFLGQLQYVGSVEDHIACPKITQSLKSQGPQGFSGCLDIGSKGASIYHVVRFSEFLTPPSPLVVKHGHLANPPIKPRGHSRNPPNFVQFFRVFLQFFVIFM